MARVVLGPSAGEFFPRHRLTMRARQERPLRQGEARGTSRTTLLAPLAVPR